jgi:hypothetical protein
MQCVLQGDAVGVRRVRSSLSMRVPTPTQTVHHIVFCSTSTTRSPSTMRCAWRRCCWRSLASRSTRLAAPSRASHRVGVFRAASRRSSAATRTRGAGRVLPSPASAVRTSSMIDSVDDAGSGAPSSAGRRLMRAVASLASTSLCTAMCASDTAGRRRCAHPRRAHAGRSDR